MHAIKGGWTGQTFALAKCNDSGGKKSRIRLSKEERKKMVESFIKKYQSSNNGNFPSLNLTHKEVGGSFYTVREIVREIIQENRVLGPAKLLLEEQNVAQLLEDYPLGTISTEPQTIFSIPSGSHFAPNQHQSTGEEPALISDELCAEPEQQDLNNVKIINGSHVIEKNEESDEPKISEVLVSEPLETKKKMEDVVASRAKVTEIAEVIVETFPLRPVTKPTDYFDQNYSELRDLNGSLEDKDVDEVHLGPGDYISLPDGIGSLENSDLVDNEEVDKPGGPLLERTSGLVDEKTVENLGDQPWGSSKSSATKEVNLHDTKVDIDVEVQLSHNDKAIAKTKVVNAPNGVQTKTLDGNHASSGKLLTQEVAIENKADVQHSGGLHKRSNPTLDRIKIESRERASKTPAELETNPLWAIFKSFIDAVIKFWSE